MFRSLLRTFSAFILGIAIACGVSPAVADIVQNTIYNLGSTVVIASDGSSTSYFRWGKDIWAYAQTADGSDNGTINIAGGGAVASQGRGAYIIVRGNEASNGVITIAEGSNGGGINVTGSVAPSANATYNVGGSALAFTNVYTNNIRSSSVAADLNLRATGTQNVNIYNNGVSTWGFATGGTFVQDATNGGDIVLNVANGTIRQGTSDAADSKEVCLTGGGACTSTADFTRGAKLLLAGNEQATRPGEAYLESNGLVRLRTNTGGNIQFYAGTVDFRSTAGSSLWTVNGSTGALTSDATNGGGIVLAKSGTTLAVDSGTAASACAGTGTHNGTTAVTVSTTCATTGNRIFFADTSEPTTSSGCWVANVVNGTSFDVDCKSAGQDATFAWWIQKEG